MVRDAAAALFLEKGFADTTIQDIGDAAGLSKARAFYHISSKEALLHEILMIGLSRISRRLEEICGHPLSCSDRLRLVLRDTLTAASHDVYASIAVLRHQDLRFLTAQHRSEYVELRDRYQALLLGLLQEGAESGEFRMAEHSDLKMIAFGIVGMIAHFQRWYRADGELTPAEIADIWWAMLLHGIADAQPAASVVTPPPAMGKPERRAAQAARRTS